MTVFRDQTSHQPPRQVNGVVRRVRAEGLAMRGRVIAIQLFSAPDARSSADYYAGAFGWAIEPAVDGLVGQAPQLWADASTRLRQQIFPARPEGEFGWFTRLMGGKTLHDITKNKVILVIEVPDLEEAIKAVERHGGTVQLRSLDPWWGESCMVTDPGGVFQLLVPAPHAPDPSRTSGSGNS
jgi:predicted enzyme related to lactoylglutathione lyase